MQEKIDEVERKKTYKNERHTGEGKATKRDGTEQEREKIIYTNTHTNTNATYT